MIRLTLVALAAIFLWAPVQPAAAQEAMDKAAIEEIVRDYLLENPEIIVEAMERLQAKEREEQLARAKEAIAENSDALFNASYDPVAGNPDGDVTIVEFFDYHCGYCKRVMDTMLDVSEQDGNVRIVFKEFPILSTESGIAARAALASKNQGKYTEFHVAMMRASGRLTEPKIMAIAEDLGIDTDQLKKDMKNPLIEAQIAENYRLADALGIRGTPAFVIGEQLIPGAVGEDSLKASIAAARSSS